MAYSLLSFPDPTLPAWSNIYPGYHVLNGASFIQILSFLALITIRLLLLRSSVFLYNPMHKREGYPYLNQW